MDPSSSRQFARIGRFAETNFPEALTVGIVKEDTILLPRPNGIGLHHARPLHLKEQSTRTTRSRKHGLMDRRLDRIELIVSAQDVANMRAQSVHSGEADNGVHVRYAASTDSADTEQQDGLRSRPSLSADSQRAFSGELIVSRET
jgi:hypothetical protein